MSRVITFAYGVFSYTVFLAVFVYGVGFCGNFATPTTLDGPAHTSVAIALAIDLGLLAAFAIQHSVMARPVFKDWLTRFIPAAAERSTYVLISSFALAALFLYWEPIRGTIWNVGSGFGRACIAALYLFGWVLLLYATFLIDHFDLFGLKQVWRRLTGQAYRAPQFHTPGLYRLVRHPLYIGWLIIFWATPIMTIAHLVFAVATTGYILIAIQFEERDLVAAFGDTYEDYRRTTPMLVPRLTSGRRLSARRQTLV